MEGQGLAKGYACGSFVVGCGDWLILIHIFSPGGYVTDKFMSSVDLYHMDDFLIF